MTAVEFLIKELELDVFASDKEMSIIEQAKEMEEEQMIEFAENCLDKALDLDIRTAFSNVEQYYKQTFKSE